MIVNHIYLLILQVEKSIIEFILNYYMKEILKYRII